MVMVPLFCFSENPWFPGLDVDISVKPYLPKEFAVGSRNRQADVNEGIIWGRPEAIQRYIRNELPMPSPIITVIFTKNVRQDGPMSFNGDKGMKRELKVIGGKKLTIKKLRWGDYPILYVRGISLSGTRYHVAFLGLNQPNGETLMLNFLSPSDNNKPTEEEAALWVDLLTKSDS